MNDNDAIKSSAARTLALGIIAGLALWSVVLAVTIWLVTDGARRIHDAQIASAKLQHRIPEARP